MCLEHDSALTVCWFESNCMKLNTDKCHLINSGNKHESFWSDIGNGRIWESNHVKLGFHVLKLCSKANRKLNILSRISSLYPSRKGEYLLRHTLNLILNIAHFCGCFMEDRLIIK